MCHVSGKEVFYLKEEERSRLQTKQNEGREINTDRCTQVINDSFDYACNVVVAAK